MPAESSHKQQKMLVKNQPTKQTINSDPCCITTKGFISEEMRSDSAQQETHRVNACAMGVGTMPSELRPFIYSRDHTNGNLRNCELRKNSHGDPISTKYERLNMMASYQSARLRNPHRREHPQEELLQRFKKEFKAWQEARVWELYGGHLNGRSSRSEPPDAATRRASSLRKPVESLPSSTTVSTRGKRRSSTPENLSREHLYGLVEARRSRNRENATDLGRFPELKLNKRVDRSSSPTRIVILQPSTDRSEDSEELWPCSSGEDSTKYFLEEVRERLRSEVHGKARNKTRTRECPNAVPFGERQTMARQVRERATGDFGATGARTGSARSYGRRVRPDGSDPPAFVERDAQRLLHDRLRNVSGRPSTESSVLGDVRYEGDVRDELGVRARSFREGQVSRLVGGSDQDPSAILARCFSAPMSEKALGRLLLREQDNMMGVHSQSQLEPTEKSTEEVRKLKKDVFNIKGKISYLRRALTLPGKLFRRKNRPGYDPGEDKTDPIETTATPPSLELHSGIARARMDNSTEVPPSPASICRGSYEDVWKPGFPSPVSPLEMSFNGDYPFQISEEISSDTPEVPSQSAPAETPGCEQVSNEEQLEELHDDEHMKSQEENYLRHILLTAGLYNQPLNLILALCNSPTEPLAEWVFEDKTLLKLTIPRIKLLRNRRENQLKQMRRCNCRTCLRGDNLIKARLQEMSSIDKLRHLHRILSFLLPMLKRIHAEQCYELDLEIRVYGIKNDIPRAKLQPDEQMCCDSCKVPILDYHRHCTNCQFDLCLMCCQDLRRLSHSGIGGELGERQAANRIIENGDGEMPLESSEEKNSINSLKNHADDYAIDFSHLFPEWKANSDDSIPCPQSQTVACCNSALVLRRILKINWVARLLKHAEEMVNGCKISASSMTFQSSHSTSTNLYKCSQRENSFDNFLYCPALQDIEHECISHFHTHWEKGEPVVIRRAFEPSLSACWDPMSIWRGIQEMTDDRIKEDDVVVKAINCSNQSEVDIDLRKFIRGYMDGCLDKYGFPEILKLKDWPSENDVEEFLLCQRPEFLSKLPLFEYFHPKWGLLNLAAKLPHDSAPSDAGPKFLIAYGGSEEHNYVSVLNLRINIGDVVYLLMHTSEGKYDDRGLNKFGTIPKNYDESELYVKSETMDGSNSTVSEHCTNNQACGLSPSEKEDDLTEVDACNGNEISPEEKKESDLCHTENGLAVNANAGAIWDVFRRQDVPKLNEYLKEHWEDLRNPVISSNDTVTLPLHEQGVVLDGDHKKRLKDELGIEPWTFEQHVGEAVFVPAGCPFQVRNRQSTVQLCLDFLSPESLVESARIAQEIRSLPSYHDAKLHMLEVGKMCLYAASASIRDIQKTILDPKFLSGIVFEDRNLTAGVSESLERITKRRQIACL